MSTKTLLLSSAALLATLGISKADSEAFSLISIRSGSALQYSTILFDTESSSDGYYPITVGASSGSSWEFVIDEKGYLIANDTYYWGIIPNSDGQYGMTTSASKAVAGFSIADGNLANSESYFFEAVPEGTTWDLYSTDSAGTNGNTDNNLNIALACYTATGFAPDFTPSDSSNASVNSGSSNSTSTSSVSSNTTTTLTPTANTTSSASVSSAAASSSSSAVATTSAVSANTTSSSNSTSSSTSSHKNGAAVAKGSMSLLAMGLVGLFL